MDVRKTVLVGHSAERMFDLIEAAEHYPDFLPWCAAATIVERDDAIGRRRHRRSTVHGVRFGFRTRNPKRRPEWMAIHLERGPFRHFDGEWDLTPLAADGCRIDFELRYDFDSTAMRQARAARVRPHREHAGRRVRRARRPDHAAATRRRSADSRRRPPPPAAAAAAPPCTPACPDADVPRTSDDPTGANRS